MTGPGFVRGSALIALKDLRLEWRTLEALGSSVLFALIVIMLFSFAFGVGAAEEFGVTRLVPGVLWTVFAFASVVGMSRSMQLERRRETLSALFAAPVDRGAIYTGKMLANFVKLTILQWIVLPLSAVLFDYDLRGRLLPLALVLFIHGLGLTELGTLFSAISTRLGRGEALLATLLFPAAVPLVLAAVRCTGELLGGGQLGRVSGWLGVAAGFTALYFFVALLTFEFVLEE